MLVIIASSSVLYNYWRLLGSSKLSSANISCAVVFTSSLKSPASGDDGIEDGGEGFFFRKLIYVISF